MTPPIRPAVHTLVDWEGEPATWTLRQAIDWFKKVVRGFEPLGDITQMEKNYVDKRWAVLCTELAKAQGVPAGMLSYFLGETAQAEIKLKDTADAEFQAAVSYPS